MSIHDDPTASDTLRDHVDAALGRTGAPTPSYGARHAHALFGPIHTDANGIGSGQPTEIRFARHLGPLGEPLLSTVQLISLGVTLEQLEAARAERDERRSALQSWSQRLLYSQVAEGESTEAGFEHGERLAETVGYSSEETAHASANTLDRFVGLGRPWSAGEALPGTRVLDLGCGAGLDLAIAHANVGIDGAAVGLDLTFEMVRAARTGSAALTTLPVVNANAHQLPFQASSFDLVTANGMLVVCSDVPAVLAEVRRVLRPAGRFQFAEMTYGVDKEPGAFDDLDRWNRACYRRRFVYEWRALLAEAGFVAIEVFGPVSPFAVGSDNAQAWVHTFSAKSPPMSGYWPTPPHHPGGGLAP